MKVKVYPSKASGSITVPPSKSLGHRAIICACLAEGTSMITNIVHSEDIKATIAGMAQLGAQVRQDGECLSIKGVADFAAYDGSPVNCAESGSTLRFFVPIFSLTGRQAEFTGARRLFERPQSVYAEMFARQGLTFNQNEESVMINGSLKAGEYVVDGNISSQFISGLLFALPLLEGDSVITVRPPFESASYVTLTVQMLGAFGVKIIRRNNTFYIKGGQKYRASHYAVEGDYSQLGFMAVLAAINSDIACTGLNTLSAQGDRALIQILKNAGVSVKALPDGFYIHKSGVKGSGIDLADCPDLGPALMVLAMYGEGTTRIYNAGRLRYKESDRIAAMEAEFLKLGVDIKTCGDEILITGCPSYKGGADLNGHNDHRIVMSLAVAATVCEEPVVIHGAEAVNKSYPGFFEDLNRLNIKVEYL